MPWSSSPRFSKGATTYGRLASHVLTGEGRFLESVALVIALRTSYTVAVHATGALQDAATAIVCLQLTVFCLCLTGPVFNTQLGIQFWAVTGAVLGPLLAMPDREFAEKADG